jgi:TP901-1 family phage major tail protein
MGAQRGQDMLLKIDDGGSYLTLAGLRSRSIALNSESIDVTTGDAPERWRELLGGAGVRRASITASGIFRDSDSDARLRSLFFGDAIADFQIILPDFGALQGSFQILSLDYTGSHESAVTFDIALESAAALTFVAEA